MIPRFRRKALRPSSGNCRGIRRPRQIESPLHLRGRSPLVFVIVSCMVRNFLWFALLLAAMPAFARHKDRFLQPGPIHVDRSGQKWVDKTLRKMSPDEKVGQLFAIWV